jgi:hypothetical protein
MMMKIYIDMKSDAFKLNPGHELARILQFVAGSVNNEPREFLIGLDRSLFDINGNNVGYFTIIE